MGDSFRLLQIMPNLNLPTCCSILSIISPSKSGWFISSEVVQRRHQEMKNALVAILFILFIGFSVFAQEKGVDNQNERIRDAGNSRTPAKKQDVGAGRGIDFGKGKTLITPPTPNPYRLTARRDVLIKAITDLLHERKLVLDETASRPNDGVIISQPYTFIKGTVVAFSELGRLAEVPDNSGRGWTRGRYTLTIEVQPIDGLVSNVSVTAKIEGRTDGASGAEWLTLRSNGNVEQDFLNALIQNITGTSPITRTTDNSTP